MVTSTACPDVQTHAQSNHKSNHDSHRGPRDKCHRNKKMHTGRTARYFCGTETNHRPIYWHHRRYRWHEVHSRCCSLDRCEEQADRHAFWQCLSRCCLRQSFPPSSRQYHVISYHNKKKSSNAMAVGESYSTLIPLMQCIDRQQFKQLSNAGYFYR